MISALPTPYLLFLGDATNPAFGKTAFGLRDWAPELCVGECSVAGGTLSLGIPVISPRDAHAAGARSMVIGVAAPGGALLPAWKPRLIEALEAGLDIVSGMHGRWEDEADLVDAVARSGRRWIDVRRPPTTIPIATGRHRTGKRLLTVGTDCALGKKYTALAIARAARALGIDAEFRPTGQTGMIIAGAGVPIDAVIGDFISGAGEMLSPDAAPGHWDIVEGQGSLFHPAFAGVSLGLLHGSQPDVIVVCHEPGRANMVGWPDYPLPSIEETIELNLRMGRRTNPAIRCGGVSLNTGMMDTASAEALLEETARRFDLPVADPMRPGPALQRLVTTCLGDVT